MADMSKFYEQRRAGFSPEQVDEYVAGLKENIANAPADWVLSLIDRLQDAEQMWRYFTRRDEMNAEVHLKDAAEPNVRYSPITLAAERVTGWLARFYYGSAVEYSVSHAKSVVEVYDPPEAQEAPLHRAERCEDAHFGRSHDEWWTEVEAHARPARPTEDL